MEGLGLVRYGEITHLVVVADHEDIASWREGVKEGAREVDIKHRRLVDDDRVRLERIRRAALVTVLARIELEQAVQGDAGRCGEMWGDVGRYREI